MTTTQAPATAVDNIPATGSAGLGFGRLLRAEWTKIRSVRSTVWSLLAFVIVSIGFSVLVATVISHTWNNSGNNADHARLVSDPTAVIFGPGLYIGQLALCVLGVIVITSEYTTGAIRSSLLAVPVRLRMLAAKAVTFALLDLVVSAVAVFVIFFVSTAILHSHVAISFSQPNVTRAVIGAILYLTVLGLFAMAIGGLIRHTAGGITIVIGVVLLVPILVSLIPGNIAHHVYGYLPTVAGPLIAQTAQESGDVLSAWQGFGVFCAWTAVLMAACGWLLVRRDA
jgi:ABC-2 type transport system permease protein